METWEETLSPEYHRTSDHSEVGCHLAFGDVNPNWYDEYYWQERAKLQVQRQIRFLMFDLPGNLPWRDSTEVPNPRYEVSWRFIVPYTSIYRMTTDTSCGL